MTDEPAEFPDLPAFRGGATKRAVWRGIFHTSLLVVGWLIVITFVAAVGGHAAMVGLGRKAQLDRVVVAWQAAHPEFRVGTYGTSSSGPYSANSSFGVGPVTATGLGPTSAVSFRVNLFGHLSTPPIPGNAASRILAKLGKSEDVPGFRKTELVEFKALPPLARVGAIIEFASPLSEADFGAFRQTHDPSGKVFSFADVIVNEANRYGVGVLGWQPFYDPNPKPGRESMLDGFRRWVHGLDDSDRDGLNDVGADLDQLRTAARNSKVYGVIVNNVTADYLLKLFDDPKVMLIHPYDIQYAVEGG
jgi:hypothetical protein